MIFCSVPLNSPVCDCSQPTIDWVSSSIYLPAYRLSHGSSVFCTKAVICGSRATRLLNWLISIGTIISVKASSTDNANTITIIDAAPRLKRLSCSHSTSGFST